MSISKHEDSDGTGYCRGCGTTINEEHLPDCDLDAMNSARLLADLVLLRDECLAEKRNTRPLADPTSDIRRAYGGVADSLTALIKRHGG